jgi:hypothetical protein
MQAAGPVGAAAAGLSLFNPDPDRAVLVIESGEVVVVAFGGEVPRPGSNPERMLRNWIGDLDAELVPAPGLPGLVHAGFAAALPRLWALVLPVLRTRLAGVARGELWLTGHGTGGALANLAAVHAAAEPGLPTPVVRTFGSPQPGDPAFAAGYAEAVPDSIRWEFADDLVPHLPPGYACAQAFAGAAARRGLLVNADRDYRPVGSLRYVTRTMQVCVDSPLLRFQRTCALARLLLAGQVGAVVADHDPTCAAMSRTVCRARSSSSRNNERLPRPRGSAIAPELN